MDPEHYVLVVDDDATIRKVMTGLLDFAGYRYAAAATTQAALAIAEAELPTAIVLDMRMPDDGPVFQQELKRRAPHVPIIATSASLEGPAWAHAIGAVFLRKPFTVDQFLDAVHRASQHRAA